MKKYELQNIWINDLKENDNYKAYLMLLKEYQPLIVSISNNTTNVFKNSPILRDDMINVLNYEFYKLTKQYDPTKNMNYASYMKKFLMYKSMNYSRLYIGNKHKTLNFSKNDDDSFENYAQDKLDFYEEDYLDFIKNSNLTDLEKKVMLKLLAGYKMIDVAKEEGKSKQTIYAAKERAMAKLRKRNIFNDI